MKLWLFLFVLLSQSGAFAKSKVVTTFSVLGNIAERLVDDDIGVINLVGGGIDPHLFEPGPKDINHVRGARILFANGLHFEPWLDRLVKAAAKDLVVVYASKSIQPRQISEHGLKMIDPHAWNSPRELISYIQVMAEELSKAFPKQSTGIQKRASVFVNQIQSIDSKFTKEFSKIPTAKRVILTTHDAAGYLALDYEIKTIAPIGLSTSEDFKTADLTNLIAELKLYRIDVIFTEPSHHKVLTERLAAKTNLKVGPELYLDGLSERGGAGDTVEKMLTHNLESILASMK
ncbi:MAG: zinc ABC transporter substrate-binding protein [Bdellovibrionales bacterium]|nr:zinc ABC transporter substrate-binding protein [Bdellovibrionales bacterium]